MHDNPYPKQRLFVEPRCCTFAAIGIGISAVGLGTGIASAAGAFSPSINEPNTAQEAEQMQALEAQYLPAILGIEAAQQEGGSYTLSPDVAQALQREGVNLSGGQLSPQQQQNFQGLQTQLASLQSQLANTPHSLSTGENIGHGQPAPAENPAYRQLQQQIANVQSQIQQAQKTPSTVNFSGEGTANIQGQIEQQLAQGQLQEGQQYDPQFIAQALQEEQKANPQQAQARTALYNDIQNEISNPLTSPVSQTMENQVQQQVNAGSNLTPQEQQMLQAAVTQSGGSNGTDFSSYLTGGQAGEQRALENAGRGASFLASGETPADIAYRQQQQNLSNLGSFISGATPESQFGELSGAQTGPTPDYQSGYLPGFNGQEAAALGQGASATQYGENVNEALQQANPWTAGLSAVLAGTNTLANAGAFG